MMKIDSKSGGNEVIFLSFIAPLALKKRYYKKDCSFMYFHKVIKAVNLINIKDVLTFYNWLFLRL